MTENIKDTVNQLYALRAGISAISMENDIARKDIGIAEKNYTNEISVKMDLEKKISKFETEKKSLNGASTDAIHLEQERIKKKRKLWLCLETILFIIAILCGICTVGELFTGCQLTETIPATADLNSDSRFIFNPTDLIIFAISVIACLIFFGLGMFIYGIDGSCEKREKELEEKLANIEKVSSMKRKTKIDRGDLSRCNEKLAELKLTVKNKREFYGGIGNAMYDALAVQYSSLLDPRDWEHLDLVIFYLETGRAESMKEALQQVDKQLQTDSIISAINIASREIRATIQRGFANLNNTIIGCASVLSAQLQEISLKQSAISGQLSSVSNLLSAQSMQKALTSKANVSSKKLMEDVHQMRVYAENAEIRRRNS